VVLACVCGSDVWYYRGQSQHAAGSIGHEFIGIVEETGGGVTSVAAGDLVVAPFIYSDMTCPHCRNGSTISCPVGGNFGDGTIDGGQGEAVRVPQAQGTLVKVPGTGHSGQELRSLLTLSDVMATGHHAAISAGVKTGDVVAVVGDGAVGLCAVLAAHRLGAGRIIALSRHPPARAAEGEHRRRIRQPHPRPTRLARHRDLRRPRRARNGAGNLQLTRQVSAAPGHN
jgi:threonine dehydrogenase-like Zn-dependent dehydrogenase